MKNRIEYPTEDQAQAAQLVNAAMNAIALAGVFQPEVAECAARRLEKTASQRIDELEEKAIRGIAAFYRQTAEA